MPSVLTSWKEIGQYLGKGVRTVQRWELDAGLPVRRPTGSSSHAVLAIPEELDAWTHSRTKGPGGPVIESIRKELIILHQETADLRKRLALIEIQTAATNKSANVQRSPGLDPLHNIPVSRGDQETDPPVWSNGRQIRAQTIRERLSYAAIICAIGESESGYGKVQAIEKALHRAETSVWGIRRSLNEPGYVPVADLSQLRDTLDQIQERIRQVLTGTPDPAKPSLPVSALLPPS